MANPRKPSQGVGYKRPPRASQFRPGQSGNPKGRPKGKLNLLEILEQELNRRIGITEGGTRKKISLRVAAMKQLVNKAVGGDIRSLTLVLKELGANGAADVLTKPSELDGPDELVMESIIRRIRAMDPPAPDAANPATPEQN